MAWKEEVINLIKSLDKDLGIYQNSIYSAQEKKDIKKFEEQSLQLYNDFKKDGFLKMEIPKEERAEYKRIVKFSQITSNIPNRLLKAKEFLPEEQWYILLAVYCWWCEMVKNLLSEIAKEIYHSLKDKEWEGFMMLGQFLKTMNEYKNGKYAFLFSDIDVDLRNSFVHGEIDFPNNEVIYYSSGIKKVMNLETLLSKFKKLPPLYAYLFSSRLKPFRNEIIAFAKEKGYC